MGKTVREQWEDIYDECVEADFNYKGRKYLLDLGGRPAYVYDCTDLKKGERLSEKNIIATYNSKEEFYNSYLFGIPILKVFDEAVITIHW